MKLKITVLAGALSFFAAPLIARPLLDSIGVENKDGKKVILHKLDPKESYYSLGRKYNVKPGAIMQFNNNAALKIGDVVKVPTELPFISAAPVVATQPSAPAGGSATEYKVSQGETLYAISRRFGVRVEDIIAQNGLKSNSLHPGQVLRISGASASTAPQNNTVVTNAPAQANTPPAQQQQTPAPVIAPRPDTAKRDTTAVTHPDSTAVNRPLPANRYGITERNEKGVATFIDDAGLDPNKKLVLHRTAPVGTVLKITNPMTNRTTFAKVVGRFTDNEMTKDVVVVLTKSAADALGALDKRFYVNISYGMPTNEQ
ncbi:LysM peptidoglycan-binding domain-containing protein [Mucilaginibacter daejeonensis]|uniref:DPBB and LysM peptidoglycan-binding domain-containing protein n=1 Tax=Mucilaginibacter daejeonensis TaxID=398049 RepID=UPI001D171B99|nr:LysM peptidoglycan-binding domain-containing protein [Mucilaginibacter daejeonensis]UEG52209.1 LysM peptidoglycan-binding domain-containing protein [Mucilaginibacter daejeonensis]